MNLEELKTKLIDVEYKIQRETPKPDYTTQVAKHFHLGMVGGSGRNIHRLNKRREQSLNRSINAAVILTKLYKERDHLKAQIEDIESGNKEKRMLNVQRGNEPRAEYWRRLKVGDELNVGNPNGNQTITKKNAKSVETGSGCKWTAAEVIGREAAKLL